MMLLTGAPLCGRSKEEVDAKLQVRSHPASGLNSSPLEGTLAPFVYIAGHRW